MVYDLWFKAWVDGFNFWFMVCGLSGFSIVIRNKVPQLSGEEGTKRTSLRDLCLKVKARIWL
jgi:hypothetical protein